MSKKQLVAIYTRVSTEDQAREGYSIDEQKERLTKYADAHDWTISEIYCDPGFSGGSLDRPFIKKLIEDAQNKKFDKVLVYKLDRLSRSQKDTLYLIEDVFLKNNVDFVSMTENFDTATPFGKAMIGILSVFAQLEREQIKERLAMGHVGRAKNGLWRGGSNPPIGYDYVDGRLVINEYEALQIRTIYKMFLDGETIHGISKYMNTHFTNKYSSYADAGQTGVILRNSLYIGKIKYKGEEYDGVHEPIIDHETFDRVQKRYKEISSTWSEHYRSPYKGKHLLTGLIFCGNCGARYFACGSRVTKRDADGKQKKLDYKYTYYKCYSRDKNSTMKKSDNCKNPTYKVEYLNGVIMDEIKKLKLDPDYLDQIIKTNKKDTPSDSGLIILQNELKEVESKISKLLDLYTIGTIPIGDIGDRVKPLYDSKNKLEAEIKNRKSESHGPDILSLSETRYLLDQIDIDNSDHDTKRQIVQALIKKIVIMPEPDTIKIYWKFV